MIKKNECYLVTSLQTEDFGMKKTKAAWAKVVLL